jgi:hypothetical protein
LADVIVRQAKIRAMAREELATPFETLFQCRKGTREPPPVDRHHEPESLALALVLSVEVRDVLLDAVIELALTARLPRKNNPLVSWFPAGNAFGKEPSLAVAAKKRPGAPPHDASQWCMALGHFVQCSPSRNRELRQIRPWLLLEGQVFHDAPLDRAEPALRPLGERRVELASGAEEIAEHPEEERPVRVINRFPQLTIVGEKGVLVSLPASADP